MGVVGLAAAVAGSFQDSPDRWMAVWVGAAIVAFAIGLAAISRKAARNNTVLTGALARNFAVAMLSPLIAGAGVTYALWSSGAHAAMPAAWLLMYGAGVITGGMFSVRIVRASGVAFMALGFAAAFTPAGWSNAWLGAGFGLVHIVSGINIKRHHGG